MMTVRRLLQRSVDFVPGRLRGSIRRLPLVAPLQRAFVARVLSSEEFEYRISAGPAKGLLFPISLPQDKMIWTGMLEFAFASRLHAAVRPGDVCFDIGSHRGYMAGVMAIAGAREVHCFDPNPENAGHLRRLGRLNSGYDLRVHECALGERDGTSEFFLMPESSMGKLAESSFQAEVAHRGAVTVPVHCIDSLTGKGELPAPQLIKVDVEGAELAVLHGGRETIVKHRPTVFLEYHTPELRRQCSEWLVELGYVIESLGEGSAPDGCPGHLLATYGNALR